MMEDIKKSPYAGFLEDMCRNVLELKPAKIAVVAIQEDGTVLTGTHRDCSPWDLGLMAFHMQADALFEVMKANAGEILKAAEEEDGEEQL